MPKLIFAILITLLLVSGAINNAHAGTIAPELQPVLDAKAPDEMVDVIIILADQVDVKVFKDQDKSLRRSKIVKALKDKADKTQKDLKTFLKQNGVQNKDIQVIWLINTIALTVRADLVSELAAQPGVAEVRLDFAIPLGEVTPAAATTPEWNLVEIGATELWNVGFRGQGVVVANMDTGVDVAHADLAGRWRGGANSWRDPNGEHASPHDSHALGHGTGSMGIMVGGDATGTSIGVAPDAQWIAVKIFNDAGVAPLSGIHQGFQWMLDPDGNSNTDDAPNVVNNSWGFRELVDVCYLEFQQDIQTLKASEIAVVFSAGNEAPGAATSISPANNPQSFAVGSVHDTLNIANSSSRGPSACVLENDIFPEVVAPGVSIKTADLTLSGVFPNSSHYVSGTSFAAPHVAGAFALLLSAFPQLTVAEIELALKDTALDLGVAGPDNDYGYGLINVLEAYRSLVPCSDVDVDGYFAEAVCGTSQDCNDNDASIYPTAPEIKHDGIDQDCNGYDLTIDIPSAVYNPATDELYVAATSDLGELAGLTLVGSGSMGWNVGLQKWEITVASAGGNPGIVTVLGTEGSEIATTDPCTDPLDSDGDTIPDLCDNCTLVANTGQIDTDSDFYGNACDTDLNNDAITNGLDVGQLRLVFLNTGPGIDADFNSDEVVNGLDVGIFRLYFLQPPGPSGLVP